MKEVPERTGTRPESAAPTAGPRSNHLGRSGCVSVPSSAVRKVLSPKRDGRSFALFGAHKRRLACFRRLVHFVRVCPCCGKSGSIAPDSSQLGRVCPCCGKSGSLAPRRPQLGQSVFVESVRRVDPARPVRPMRKPGTAAEPPRPVRGGGWGDRGSDSERVSHRWVRVEVKRPARRQAGNVRRCGAARDQLDVDGDRAKLGVLYSILHLRRTLPPMRCFVGTSAALPPNRVIRR